MVYTQCTVAGTLYSVSESRSGWIESLNFLVGFHSIHI